MAYVTVENLPRPTRKRKWSSSATKATPSCHDWKREVGHNKFTSALSQIKGYPRLLPNGRPVARGAQGKSMGDQISVQGARAGA